MHYSNYSVDLRGLKKKLFSIFMAPVNREKALKLHKKSRFFPSRSVPTCMNVIMLNSEVAVGFFALLQFS